MREIFEFTGINTQTLFPLMRALYKRDFDIVGVYTQAVGVAVPKVVTKETEKGIQIILHNVVIGYDRKGDDGVPEVPTVEQVAEWMVEDNGAP